MEKVLLAIDGTTPNRKSFKYAVDLCARIKADLKILQIVRPNSMADYIATIKNTAKKTTQFLESSIIASTFAEAGEQETALTLMNQARMNTNKLLPESAKAGVTCDLLVRSGDATEEIVNYVRDNKDIVIAVYDGAQKNSSKSSKQQKNSALESITKGLSVPVVMLQAEA